MIYLIFKSNKLGVTINKLGVIHFILIQFLYQLTLCVVLTCAMQQRSELICKYPVTTPFRGGVDDFYKQPSHTMEPYDDAFPFCLLRIFLS